MMPDDPDDPAVKVQDDSGWIGLLLVHSSGSKDGASGPWWHSNLPVSCEVRGGSNLLLNLANGIAKAVDQG